MQKINSKYFSAITSLLVGISVLFFISFFLPSAKIRAQSEELSVETTHYSVLSSNVFVLGGAYFNNIDRKPLTTYFEYKRDDSIINDNDFNVDIDLDDPEDRQETIKIVRGEGVKESGEFHSSPSLQLSSTYYFRAMGYFNDNESEKFYGRTLSFRTGFPYPGSLQIPFTVEFDEQEDTNEPPTPRAVTYTPPVCEAVTETLVNGVCVEKASTPLIPSAPPSFPPDTPPSSPPVPPGVGSTDTDSVDSGSSLVKCGTVKYKKGEEKDENGNDKEGLIKNPCGFKDFITLINNVITFILKYMVVPIAAIMFAYAGFLLITAGGEAAGARTKAKNIFMNALIGLIIAVGAWLIVKTLIEIIGYEGIGTSFLG